MQHLFTKDKEIVGNEISMGNTNMLELFDIMKVLVLELEHFP